MASLDDRIEGKDNNTTDLNSQKQSRPNSVEKKIIRDREEKIRLARERQNEERQKKIEELKIQAEAAQKYREQKELERRKRIEEMKNKDYDRRQQVEERKKAIIEAENERREFILRKNQERETKLDCKRRQERNSISYAFGSSTPRLLDPAELASVSPGSYWGHRRSTSITNVTCSGASLTRRSSERELFDNPKKRATSAGVGERKNEDEATDSPAVSFRSVARRKTDLIPTIPSPRDSSFGSKTSLQCHTPRTPGSRSGDVTPVSSSHTSRPGSAMSTSASASGLVHKRTTGTPRKPRPASIAGTIVTQDDIIRQKKEKPPLPKNQITPKRSSLNNSNSGLKLMNENDGKQHERKYSVKKDTPVKQKINITPDNNVSATVLKESIPIKEVSKKTIPNNNKNNEDNRNANVSHTKEEKEAINVERIDTQLLVVDNIDNDNNDNVIKSIIEEKLDDDNEKGHTKQLIDIDNRENSVDRPESDMTASMIARSKITTEEEAKAALAERRRLAREEAEKQAELERLRLEAEKQAEIQRQIEEEERQLKLEEEALRLAEEQRKGEQERLLQAIEEVKKREEENKLKREEEEKLRIEKEEAEKKAKEEAERLRIENNERVKREEKEREERRKRVEAIMARTRSRGGNSTPNSTPTKDTEENKNLSGDEKSSDNSTSLSIIQKEHLENKSHEFIDDNDDQMLYEKSVTNKENSLISSFSNMMKVDDNSRNFQITNGKNINQENELFTQAIANGNGHIQTINKNDPKLFENQLIDFNNESEEISDVINFNNNNRIITSVTSTPLVTADNHEPTEISLL